jgi:hypothetical protein
LRKRLEESLGGVRLKEEVVTCLPTLAHLRGLRHDSKLLREGLALYAIT